MIPRSVVIMLALMFLLGLAVGAATVYAVVDSRSGIEVIDCSSSPCAPGEVNVVCHRTNAVAVEVKNAGAYSGIAKC